ncbi:ricin-type beta-trefoil lectin domain protein [Amycolatopsis sp. H20-H5]|uniref:ricin-type beta-trefoil lectin domain protein n=1 Tax=Amycolatopsis sp. H20-H5 TaxID=3046309 RepID=UPI002DB5F6B8|nr:ricin-type beta-trefoil lectin domain protein [Amycolatopsis sp. H20-H5]MEC3978810.1 ricin-type beta-trefoil lectin domain protein [Amycolatopsis sp. H20-H5]
MRGLWVAAVLLIASGAPATAQQAGVPVYLADGGGTVSLAAADGKPLLADAKDPKAQWAYDKTTLLYRNVASGQCLTAQSPVDGVTVRMTACDDKDRHQQWRRGAGTPGLVVIANVATARCLTAEAPAVGSRLYQEVCSLIGVSNYWAAGGRTLGILSGNGQRLASKTPGEPFVVRVIGENGQPADAVAVSFFVRSARPKNVLAFEGGAETATAKTGPDGKASSPKIVLAEPGEFDIKFTGSASLDDGNTITFEGSCLC